MQYGIFWLSRGYRLTSWVLWGLYGFEISDIHGSLQLLIVYTCHGIEP